MVKKTLFCAFLLFGILGCEPETTVDTPLDGGAVTDSGDPADDLGADPNGTDAGSTEGCETSDDCSTELPVCTDDGACVECIDNTFCPALQPVCAEDNTCTDMGDGICREDFDCENVDIPICLRLMGGQIGVCVECLTGDDCIQSRPVCSSAGRCVADESEADCTTDAECGPPRRCEAGSCIEREIE